MVEVGWLHVLAFVHVTGKAADVTMSAGVPGVFETCRISVMFARVSYVY